MNEEIIKLYDVLKREGYYTKSLDEFKGKWADESYKKKVYNVVKRDDLYTKDYNSFISKYSLGQETSKKKEPTVLPSVQKVQPISSGTQPKATQKPLATSVSKKDKDREGFYTLESKDVKVYTGLPGKEKTQYRVLNNKWQRRDESGWRDLDSQNSIDLLNKYFNKTVKSREDITRGLESNVKKTEVEKELSDKELASVLGWSEQEVKKSKAGSGSPDKDFKAAMVKPDMVKPSESNAIGTMAVSTQKAYSDLGPSASSEEIKKKTKYYDTVESQKYLKSIGYDIDVNGDESDEKTKIALNKEKVKQDVITKDAFKAADTYESIDNEINQDLLLNDEEFVVTELRKKYSKDGFYFEETGAGDSMIVKYSPIEGVETRQIEIPLNTNDINNVNALKDFMKQSYMTASERKNLNSEELDIRTQEGRDAHIDKLLKLMADNPYKYGSSLLSEDEIENHINNSYSNLKEQSKNLQQEYKALQYRIDKFNQNPSNPQEKAFINNKIHELSQKELQINNRYNDLSSVDKSINKIASINYNKSKEPGNWIGVLGSQFIQGITNPEKALTQISMDVLPYALEILPYSAEENIVDPMTRQKLKDQGYTDIQILDYASKELKNNLYENLKEGITNVSSLGTTTSDYVNSKDRNDLLKAASFLAESIGTSLSAGGNPTLQKVAFFTQSYNSMEEQMVGPEFESLNEWQKKLISVPYGFVIGALERYGIAALGEGANPVVNRFATAIVNRTMLSLPKDATVDTIKREINKNVGAMIAQGALKVVGGSLVEGGTEATQQLFEIGEKFLVNKIVGSDKEPGFEYFKDVPDITTADGLKKAFEIAGTDFYYGALGGLLMSGGVNAYQTTKQNSFNKKTDQEFEAFYDSMTDDKLRKLNVLNTKIKLKNGEITKEEAKETIDAINSSSQKLKSLNPNLSIRDKKDAFNLMLKRDKLEQEKAPLDEAMQAPYNERITNINNELKTISENAVKESTKPVDEVTAEGGGVQYQGIEKGQPEVGQRERPVGQAAQPKTDLGNRPIEGRRTEEARITRQVINRPAVLSGFGGKTFERPLKGDVYVDGQQVVFEDRDTGRVYELGNVDEVMDAQVPGLNVEQERVAITPEGKVSIDGGNWNIQSELPTQGIEYNPAGEVMTVSLKDDAGNTKMFKGQDAVDIAYQIELQKYQTPEQQQFINDLLDQDEEFKSATKNIKPAEVAAVVQEETTPDIVPTEPTVAEEAVVEQPVAEQPVTETEQKIITNLEQKINEYESKQATEGIGTEETVTTDEGKQVKTIKLRTPKNTNTKIALAVETGTNPRAAVLKYFVSGGKINSTAIQKLFGNKQGKSIKGEVQGRIGLINNKNGKTAEQIAEYLWSEHGEQFNMNDQDFLPYVEEVISEFKGTKGMIDELLSYENKSEEDYYKQKYGDDFEGYDTSELEDAESVLDYMTDDEIIQMANEIEASERETVEMPKTIDKAINYLEDLEKKLKDFGKGTLGINIPVVVLQKAVSIAKKSLQTGKQLSEAIDDAIKYVKSTYKSLTDKESKQIESNINDLFTGKKTFEDIIKKGIIEIKPSGVTIDDVFNKSQEELESKLKSRSVKQRVTDMFRSTRETLLNRQTDIKRALRGIKNTEAKQAYAKLVDKAGASGFAGLRFKILSKKIYGKLKESEIKALDSIIYARRIISINENRRKINSDIYEGLTPDMANELDIIITAVRNKSKNDLVDAKKRLGDKKYEDLINRAKKYRKPYTGISIEIEVTDANGNIVKEKRSYNESDAQRDLVDKRAELGDERFNEINKRADIYFGVFEDNLKKLKDSGRISEETYNNLKDVEYSPIKTIKYIIKDNYDANDLDKEAARLGISKKDIMSLTDSNENGIITDSRWLLMMNLNMVESRVFENRMLNELVSAIENATAQEKIALSDYFILDNPIIGQFKDGRPKRKFDDEALPDGYIRVHYFKDGIDNYIIAREEIAKQILDVKNSKITPTIEQFSEDVPILGWLVKQITLTPSKLLRFFATGGNPFFILGNVPMDWANAVFFNQVYSHKWYEQFKVIAGVKAAWGFVKNFTKSAISKGEWNKIYMEYAEHGGLMETMSQEGLRALQEMKSTGRLAKKLPGALSPIFKSVVGAPYKLLEGYGKAMSYLGETSEIAMRLAVYEKMKSNLIDDFKKENGVNPTGKQLDDIMWEASREARELIDFNQGGSWSKEIDVFMPYFNASMQGLRKPLDYARENPTGFASSMIQLALMGGSIAIYSVASGLSAFGGDDEEDKKKKMKKALDSINAREKANYHIIFTGNIDKDGELEYIRIKKLPIASIITTDAESVIYNYFLGYNNKEAQEFADESAVPLWPSEIISRNPLIAGIYTYAENKDAYTGEKVFKEPRNKKILPTAEGIFDDKVEGIYKALAPSLGLSPARSKAFVEKFITNESTNPTINIIYAAANGIFDKGTTFGDEFSLMTEELLKHSERKFIRTTNKDIIQFKIQDEFEKREMNKETELYLKEQEMYKDIKRIYEKGDNLTVDEIIEKVKDKFDPIDQKRYIQKYYAYTQNMNIDKSLLDIVYESNPEVQAMRLYDRYGKIMTRDEINEIGKVLANAGQKFDNKAIYFYQKNYGGVLK